MHVDEKSGGNLHQNSTYYLLGLRAARQIRAEGARLRDFRWNRVSLRGTRFNRMT